MEFEAIQLGKLAQAAKNSGKCPYEALSVYWNCSRDEAKIKFMSMSYSIPSTPRPNFKNGLKRRNKNKWKKRNT